MAHKMSIRILPEKNGRLPRIPREEWESKRRPEETFQMSIKEMQPDGTFKFVDCGDKPVTMKAGLYLEDILIWCNCKDPQVEWYIIEEDGTHGTVCEKCGGVVCLG